MFLEIQFRVKKGDFLVKTPHFRLFLVIFNHSWPFLVIFAISVFVYHFFFAKPLCKSPEKRRSSPRKVGQ